MSDISNSLIDFMYVDRPKVSSLLAQFLSEGLVVEQGTTSSQQTEKKASAKVAAWLGFSVGLDGSTADASSETVKKNPEWAQAKALIQYVIDVDQQSDIDSDAVGRLCVLSGRLEVFDLGPFRKISDNGRLLDAIRKTMLLMPGKFLPPVAELDAQIQLLSSSADAKKKKYEIDSLAKRRELAAKPFNDYLELAIEGIGHFLRHSPFSTIAVLTTMEHKYWFSLKESSLLHDQGDTLLKYGYAIEGDWSIACIIDGLSDDEKSSVEDDLVLPGELPPWTQIAPPFANVARMVAGRPNGYRSLMPLVVYRELGAILK